MIVHLSTEGPWLNVTGAGSSLPHIPENQNPMQGVLRCMGGRLEAWNGTYWTPISEYASFSLSSQANNTLAWAYKKMTQEADLLHLADQNPAVADALAAVQAAEEKLQVVIALTQENK
jgi:hypothetical protein